MTNITPQRIAKLAEWAGLEAAEVVDDVVTYIYRKRTRVEDTVGIEHFDPVNNWADAGLLLERAIEHELDPEFYNAPSDFIGAQLTDGEFHEYRWQSKNPREALCLAILEMVE